MSIVFLHAFGSSHRAWEPQVQALRDHYRVYAPDLPGHGAAGGTFSLEAAVSSVRELVVAETEPVHLVGISGSATVAMLTALAEPAAVASLTLSGGVARTAGADAVQRRVMSLLPSGLLVRMFQGLYSGGRPEYQEVARDDLLAAGKATLLTGLRDLAKQDLRPQLGDIKAHTLVVVGEKDKPNVAHARELAKGIPHSEFRIIPGAGHIWNLEQPDVFTRVVLEFIGNENPVR